MAASVAIIDGGGANIASLQFALERIGARSHLTTDAAVIRSASHVILPGVGAAAAAMQKIGQAGLEEVIPALEQPVLGICLGMQLMAQRSEEDDAGCLAIFPDVATRLAASADHPVPNMGWCQLKIARSTPLLDGISDGSWFYFVHSFALPVNESTTGSAMHAAEFSAVQSLNNFHAAQFHPERSSAAGSRLLANFLQMSR